MRNTNNLRITGITPLIPPEELIREIPLSDRGSETVYESREIIEDIILGKDRRLLAVVGPCSIHDTAAALDYARKLKILREQVLDRIYVIMRVYFEKPRSVLGWRGLIIDPYLDGSYRIEEGLRIARRLLLDLANMGMPAGSEMLDPIVPQYVSDLISWAAIGARTTESQTHRNLASGLSMPVGFKNATDGSLASAVNAMESARAGHNFIGINPQGQTCVLTTLGNEASHIILRGGRPGPNYYEETVEEAEEMIRELGIHPAVMVDCSHMNSGKKHIRQERVMRALLEQRRRNRQSIIGFMLESNLVAGNQPIPEDLSRLNYGVSVTDECIGWKETEELLMEAYDAMG
ncbi:MAG: 3-deoxy-7-phosphoheptulonate synthase [Spirochaetales bacterium]|nr:3-deoxy-7-phosphoheptulonate synthase [Spirochaetales bacterium]